MLSPVPARLIESLLEDVGSERQLTASGFGESQDPQTLSVPLVALRGETALHGGDSAQRSRAPDPVELRLICGYRSELAGAREVELDSVNYRVLSRRALGPDFEPVALVLEVRALA